MNIWNSLQEIVISADITDTLKEDKINFGCIMMYDVLKWRDNLSLHFNLRPTSVPDPG